MIASTPEPPYYAVIFTSIRANDDPAYARMAERMVELAAQQPGFLGVESARNEVGITVSYWTNEEAIRIWKMNSEHQIAREFGKKEWYASFYTRIAKVERDYSFTRS